MHLKGEIPPVKADKTGHRLRGVRVAVTLDSPRAVPVLRESPAGRNRISQLFTAKTSTLRSYSQAARQIAEYPRETGAMI